jgi:hypothetical protein
VEASLGVQEMLILAVLGVGLVGGLGTAVYFLMSGGSEQKKED